MAESKSRGRKGLSHHAQDLDKSGEVNQRRFGQPCPLDLSITPLIWHMLRDGGWKKTMRYFKEVEIAGLCT